MAYAVIKGLVRDTNKTPVREAIIILERLVPVFNEDLQEEDFSGVYLGHTLTNPYGEFCFRVSDRTSTYRIKVFDNGHGGGRLQ
jgi:hypothetical protein